jgi:uroporphyrinogen-III synthase
MAAPAVVVTRPEEAGRRLAAELVAADFDVLWLPAFDLGAAPEPRRVDATLARLREFDLAIFVSPAAVRATAAALAGDWPAQTAIAAVGAATAQTVRERIAGVDAAQIIAAATGGESGSEALWTVLAARPERPRRALVLRAQGGRDWLLDRLGEAGSVVEVLAVYRRLPHAVGAADLDWLATRARGGVLASVVTSSEAVDAVQGQLAPDSVAFAALRAGPALASHARIAQRLRAAGYADVRQCAPDAAAIVAELRG